MPTTSAICPLPLIPVMYMGVPPNWQAFVFTSVYMAPAREREKRERREREEREKRVRRETGEEGGGQCERAREIRQTNLLSNFT